MLSRVRFLQPHGLQPARLLCPWDSPWQEYWSGLPFPSPEDLPNPGMASVGAPRLLLLPTLVTRSQAMPSLFGHWGHPEPGSSGGPFPFSAVVRSRRQTPRAPPVAERGVPSLGCASLNSLPYPGGAASWPGPACHILVGHLSLHPSASSPATLFPWERGRAWWHRDQQAS